MSEETEFSDGGRGMSVFPVEWGIPQGHPKSQKRVNWVLERIAEHRGLKATQKRAAVHQAAIRVENMRRSLYLLRIREPF
jgi:hypothetical protein